MIDNTLEKTCNATANRNGLDNNKRASSIGGGFGKLLKIGNLPINARVEAYYNIKNPDGGADWQTVFTFQFLFPK